MCIFSSSLSASVHISCVNEFFRRQCLPVTGFWFWLGSLINVAVLSPGLVPDAVDVNALRLSRPLVLSPIYLSSSHYIFHARDIMVVSWERRRIWPGRQQSPGCNVREFMEWILRWGVGSRRASSDEGLESTDNSNRPCSCSHKKPLVATPQTRTKFLDMSATEWALSFSKYSCTDAPLLTQLPSLGTVLVYLLRYRV
jgi:hypothetical protein